MGIFHWLTPGKTNLELLDDRIWLTKRAKYSGIAASVARHLADREPPIAIFLVAHFRDCLDQLQTVATQNKFDPQVVRVLMADRLQGSSALVAGMVSQCLEIVVAERHLLRARDDAITESAQALPYRCRIVYHLSLEDPVMRIFAGEQIQSILQRLGVNEEEAIENRMITRRMEAAAREIESRVPNDFAADSAEQWVERNCPDLWIKLQR